MRYLTPLLALLFGVFIIGCQPEKVEFTPTKTLVSVEEPHSMFMTSTGRLFINNKLGKIYEVVEANDGYQLEQFNGEECKDAYGLAEKNGWLFSVCIKSGTYNFAFGKLFGMWGPDFRYSSSRLMAYPLKGQNDSTTFMDVGNLTEFTDTRAIVAMTTKNELIIGQDCPFCLSRVGKIELDFSGDMPTIVNQKPTWAGYFGDDTTLLQRLEVFDEIAIIDDIVYIAASNNILRVDVNENDDSTHLNTFKATFKSSFKNIKPYCDGMLVANSREENGNIRYVTVNKTPSSNVVQAYVKSPIDIIYNASSLVDEDSYLVLQAPERVKKDENEEKDKPKIGALVKVSKDSFRAPCGS